MLPELQKQFMNGIVRSGSGLLKHLNARNLDTKVQLDIYRSSYQGGLLKALTEIYPVTHKILGEEFFNAMCIRYIKQTPCRSIDLNQYGESLSLFVAGFKPVQKLVYLTDVLRLEWAWHRAYQAPDNTNQDFTPLLNMQSSQLATLRLSLQPEMSLLNSQYPVNAIWVTNQDDNNADTSIDLGTGSCQLVIWRNGLDMHIDTIDRSFFDFLCAIEKVPALSAIQENQSLFSEHLAMSLQRGYFYRYQY